MRLSPETCRVKPLRRIKTQLLHLVGLISLLIGRGTLNYSVLTVLDRHLQSAIRQSKHSWLKREMKERVRDNCKTWKVMKKETVHDVIPRTRTAQLCTSSEVYRAGGRCKTHTCPNRFPQTDPPGPNVACKATRN